MNPPSLFFVAVLEGCMSQDPPVPAASFSQGSFTITAAAPGHHALLPLGDSSVVWAGGLLCYLKSLKERAGTGSTLTSGPVRSELPPLTRWETLAAAPPP